MDETQNAKPAETTEGFEMAEENKSIEAEEGAKVREAEAAAESEGAGKAGMPKWAPAAIAVAVVAVVGIGAACALQPAGSSAGSAGAPPASASSAPAQEAASLTVEAEGWDKGRSTALVLRVADGGAERYVLVEDLAKPVEIGKVSKGATIEAIGPVNADGSFFKGKADVAGGEATLALELVAADKVTQADADALIAALEKAISSGDVPKGKAEALVKAFTAALKAAPGVDAAKVEEKAAAAEEAAQRAPEAQAGTGSPASGAQASGQASQTGGQAQQSQQTHQSQGGTPASGGTGGSPSNTAGGGTSNGGEASKPSEPERVWHEGWTEEIVHPAVYEFPPSYEVYICGVCGAEISSDPWGHIESEHNGIGSYHNEVRGGGSVLVEEEWVEVIEHPGYWE